VVIFGMLSNGLSEIPTVSLIHEINGEITCGLSVSDADVLHLFISASLRRRAVVASGVGSSAEGLTVGGNEDGGSESTDSSDAPLLAAESSIGRGSEEAVLVLDHDYNKEEVNEQEEGGGMIGKEKCPICGILFIRLETHCNA
jgi:hypothetical protein